MPIGSELERPTLEMKRPELRMSRTFDAPRARVWGAWREAERVSLWFTPKPLVTSACEVDFKLGGVFRVTMKMPDGTSHTMEGTFREIEPEERLSWGATLPDGNDVATSVTFSESGGKTTVNVHQIFAFDTPASRGAEQGWSATLDQLGELVRLE